MRNYFRRWIFQTVTLLSVSSAFIFSAQVINASWGGGPFSYALQRAIQNAASAGIVFVAAAGNEQTNNDLYPSYPANYRVANVVSVAATTADDLLDSRYSNYGATTVHLAAPGADILSTWNTADDAYMVESGTSMATPHVTGAVALLRSAYPSDSVSAIIKRLLNGTDKLPSLQDKCVSGGRLNLAMERPQRRRRRRNPGSNLFPGRAISPARTTQHNS